VVEGRRLNAFMRAACLVAVTAQMASCASLPNSDPLAVSVARIEPLPGEGMEVRLAIHLRIQNPNDAAIDYSGAALSLDVNGRDLASGVSDVAGTVPRYGETVLTIPVAIGAFNMARQVLGFVNASADGGNTVEYRVRGKLEGGLFGTRRFNETGTFEWPTGVPAPR
jgi:LEA14-like dessication related protein